jgi:DNA-binding MarR family transcriptional regulator
MTELEAAKKNSLGQVLIRTGRLFNEEALHHVRKRTGLPLRPAHMALLAYIDLCGTRATEIARRQGVSKQAVSPLLNDMIGWGVLDKVPDPDDGRAQLVRFGHSGGLSLMEGLSFLVELESELAETLGQARLDALRLELAAVMSLLEQRQTP